MTTLQRVVARLAQRASQEFPKDLQNGLREAGADDKTISALMLAILNAHVDRNAQAYADGLIESFRQYGIEGVKHQVMYLLINLGRWRGQEARDAKKLLKRWSSSQTSGLWDGSVEFTEVHDDLIDVKVAGRSVFHIRAVVFTKNIGEGGRRQVRRWKLYDLEKQQNHPHTGIAGVGKAEAIKEAKKVIDIRKRKEASR